ncbi:MAG: hypothetical protein QOG25_1658, partial [Acetobacteraceae bacterium]|nr:hypothetical protein [Acetobacteraceae bacterium]
MVGRLFIVGWVLALILRGGGANADPQPEPMLVPPRQSRVHSITVWSARALVNRPQAGLPVTALICRRRRGG